MVNAMKDNKNGHRGFAWPGRCRDIEAGQSGVTLVETMMAVVVALIAVLGIGAAIFQAGATNENQGKEMTRATVYAQDKIEKLLSLDFATCTQSSGTQPATCNSTGVSATGWTQGLLAGGQTSPLQAACSSSGPSVGYIDFLDANGVQLTGSTCLTLSSYSYVRMWSISDQTGFAGGPTLKRITVAVYSLNAVNSLGGKPIVVVTSLLSNPN
jgi:type II secretory pathway pseudopilin PulG